MTLLLVCAGREGGLGPNYRDNASKAVLDASPSWVLSG